jgi:hypothetical protein
MRIKLGTDATGRRLNEVGRFTLAQVIRSRAEKLDHQSEPEKAVEASTIRRMPGG